MKHLISAAANAAGPYAQFGHRGVELQTQQERGEEITYSIMSRDSSMRIDFNFSAMTFLATDTETGITMQGEIVPVSPKRWFSRDPKETSFPGMSPYCSMGCNPVMMVDPDGEAAEAYVDHNSKSIVVRMHYNFFGGAATDEIGEKITNQIMKDWNECGFVEYGGDIYSIKYIVTYEILSLDDAKASFNANKYDFKDRFLNNYIRIENNHVADNGDVNPEENSSWHHGNYGWYVLSDFQVPEGLDFSQVPSHEFGHGVGYWDHDNTSIDDGNSMMIPSPSDDPNNSENKFLIDYFHNRVVSERIIRFTLRHSILDMNGEKNNKNHRGKYIPFTWKSESTQTIHMGYLNYEWNKTRNFYGR